MPSLHTFAGAMYLLQVFTSAFLAILFLQSGVDKVIDRRGNREWLKGHFANSPLARIVAALLTMITIIETAAGAHEDIAVDAEVRKESPFDSERRAHRRLQ